jgi:translation initiation factor 1A
MGKNLIGGKKAKRSKNLTTVESRVLLFKDSNLQIYGKIISILGDSRFIIFCDDGKTRLGIARGKMKKRIWIKMNDLVLASLRDFEEGKIDIIHKYNDDEMKKLKKLGELIHIKIDENEEFKDDNSSYITFENENENINSDINRIDFDDI